MDGSFNNVLEGTRQYFLGVPKQAQSQDGGLERMSEPSEESGAVQSSQSVPERPPSEPLEPKPHIIHKATVMREALEKRRELTQVDEESPPLATPPPSTYSRLAASARPRSPLPPRPAPPPCDRVPPLPPPPVRPAAPSNPFDVPPGTSTPPRLPAKPTGAAQPPRMTVSVTSIVNQMNQTKQKRESPLDLSVKTVKNSADSSTTPDDTMDLLVLESKTVPVHQRPTSSGRPVSVPNASAGTSHKVDFAPDFHAQYKDRVNIQCHNFPSSSVYPPVRHNGSYETPPARPIVAEAHRMEPRQHVYPDIRQQPSAVPAKNDFAQRIDLTKPTVDERFHNNRVRDDRHMVIEERKRPGPMISNSIPEKMPCYEGWSESHIDRINKSAREQHELMTRPVYSYTSYYKRLENYQVNQKRPSSSSSYPNQHQHSMLHPKYPYSVDPSGRIPAEYHSNYLERLPPNSARQTVQKIPNQREMPNYRQPISSPRDLPIRRETLAHREIAQHREMIPHKEMAPHREMIPHKEMAPHREMIPHKEIPTHRELINHRENPSHREIITHREIPPHREVITHREIPQHREIITHRDVAPHRDIVPHREMALHRDMPQHREVPTHRDMLPHRDMPPYRDMPSHRDMPPHRELIPHREMLPNRDKIQPRELVPHRDIVDHREVPFQIGMTVYRDGISHKELPLHRETTILKEMPVPRDVPHYRETSHHREMTHYGEAPKLRDKVYHRDVINFRNPYQRDVPINRDVPMHRDVSFHREVHPHHHVPQELHIGGPADKRVLSILRNSLETKQTGIVEPIRHNQQTIKSDIIVIDDADDNVIEITDLTKENETEVESVERSRKNIQNTIKIPRAIDSLDNNITYTKNSFTAEKTKSPENDPISRIRTKGELKGLPSQEMAILPNTRKDTCDENNVIKLVPKSQKQHLFNQIREDLQLESVIKKEEPVQICVTEIKTEPMNIDEIEKDAILPIKIEQIETEPKDNLSQELDLDWATACDSFVEQLKTGCHKKKNRKWRSDNDLDIKSSGEIDKSLDPPDLLENKSFSNKELDLSIETVNSVIIKQEPVDEDMGNVDIITPLVTKELESNDSCPLPLSSLLPLKTEDEIVRVLESNELPNTVIKQEKEDNYENQTKKQKAKTNHEKKTKSNPELKNKKLRMKSDHCDIKYKTNKSKNNINYLNNYVSEEKLKEKIKSFKRVNNTKESTEDEQKKVKSLNNYVSEEKLKEKIKSFKRVNNTKESTEDEQKKVKTNNKEQSNKKIKLKSKKIKEKDERLKEKKPIVKEEVESTDDDEPLIKSKIIKEKEKEKLMKYQMLKDLSEKSAYVKLECFDTDINIRTSLDSALSKDNLTKSKMIRKTSRHKSNTNQTGISEKPTCAESSTDSDLDEVKVANRLRARKSVKTEENKTLPVSKSPSKSTPKKQEKTESCSSSSTPVRKAGFGDGSDFHPGWEEELYRYKRSLRMPTRLIAIPRGRSGGPFSPANASIFNRGSTSLPDLDTVPLSPAPSSAPSALTDDFFARRQDKLTLDSDLESNSSYSTPLKLQYDSEASTSTVVSTKVRQKGSSIVDVLIQKCSKKDELKKKSKDKAKDDIFTPKTIQKSSNATELLPTPSLGLLKNSESGNLIAKKEKLMEDIFYLSAFRKETVSAFRNAFIKNTDGLIGATEEFATVVLKTRTRTESRVLKQRATIKEVFGDERPASAPPTSCRGEDNGEDTDDNKTDILVKVEPESRSKPKSKKITKDKFRRKSSIRDGLRSSLTKRTDAKGRLLRLKKRNNLVKTLVNRKVKDISASKTKKEKSPTPGEDDKDKPKEESTSIENPEAIPKKRFKRLFGRRKFSSGFDYIRKKKKIVRREDGVVKKRRRPAAKPSPESVHDIQKEIKGWFINKSIGETHLHRAARLGFTDCVAYCLEKLSSDPSAKDNAGYTPLHVAAARGHVRIGRLLLQYGANVSAAAQGGIRPLHEAAENSHVEMIRLLLSYGADPVLGTYGGQTPVELAEGPSAMLLMLHIADVQGMAEEPWTFPSPVQGIDRSELGFDPLSSPPSSPPPLGDFTIEIQCTEAPLPPFYSLKAAPGQPTEGLWCLLQDITSLLQIKSKESLLKQIHCGSGSPKELLREIRMQEFLERAQCNQLLGAGEKVNVRASKVSLVRVTDKLRQLLKIETVLIS